MTFSYKLTWWGHILRLEDSAYIPPNEDCYAYRDYLKWLAEGNTPEPADPNPEES